MDYSNALARDLGFESRAKFTTSDINQPKLPRRVYDLGICLGALYIFRPRGWRVLSEAVKPHGFFTISDMVCKKPPPPKEPADVFFEETDQPLTLEDARHWYMSRGARTLREETCSLTAWLEYYNLTKKMPVEISKRHSSDIEVQREVEEGVRKDRLFRKYDEDYVDCVTFI